MMRLISLRSSALGFARQSLTTQFARVDVAVDQPARACQRQALEAALGGAVGHDFGDVYPRQRRAGRHVVHRLMDGVVGADEEVGAHLRQLEGAGQHEIGDTLEVAAVEAGHVISQRMRVHRHLGMRMRAHPLRAFGADGAVTKRCAFGRAADDTDVLGHG